MDESAARALYGFLSVIGGAAITQAGMWLRARRQTRKARANPDRQMTQAAISTLLETKDQKAFDFLCRKLAEAEESNSRCEARNDKLTTDVGECRSDLALAVFSIRILCGALTRAGIPVPDLPDIPKRAPA